MSTKKTNTPKKTTKKPVPKAKPSKAPYIKLFWGLFLTMVISVLMIFVSADQGWLGEMPSFDDLENPEKNLATEIISSDGKTIGTFFKENRTPVTFEELPESLVQALVATEDERFYEHSGIDARGTLRAVAAMGKKGGASTISQQLSKMLFTGGSRSLIERLKQKIKEWVIAVRLERQYTKDEIITMYLNEYDFLYQAVGVGSASRIYFGKKTKDLKIEESAVLVAMLKNPILYNPRKEKFKKNALRRRNQVLKQMEKNNYITTAEKDSLQALPMKLDFSPEGHSTGLATYFREYLREFMKDWIKKNPTTDEQGNKRLYNLYSDGLKINVTIDSRMQRYAEEAVAEHMANLQREFDRQNESNPIAPFRDITKREINTIIKRAIKRSDRYSTMKAKGIPKEEILASFDVKRKMKIFDWNGEKDTVMTPRDSIRYYKRFLHPGMMSMEPQTGYVKAWVGGNNYKHFQYDHVQKGTRQVGSTFKPFVYATAIDQLKMSPCDTLPNVQYTIPKGRFGVSDDWTPKNSGDKYGGMLSLTNALANSVNTITAQLMDRVGPVPVKKLAVKMGIRESIPEVPSIALGTVDLSVYEMVGAYSTFANKGIYNKPVMVKSIEDKNGTVLYQNTPNPKDVISEEVAYVTAKLMEGVTKTGSGVRLRTGKSYRKDFKRIVTGHPYLFENPIAGKTGTTQNQSDGWFMGFVPNLCTGVWVGAEDRATHFGSITYGQGAAMALPIWGVYMKKCYADETLDISKEDFTAPNRLSIEVDCEKYKAKIEEDKDIDSHIDEFDF